MWLKLLFFKTNWRGVARGLVSTPEFYLARTGRQNSEEELLATLRAFYLPEQNGDPDPDHHAQCRFPARLFWLTEQLQLADLPRVSCPRLREWQKARSYDSVRIVFSAFFAENPASLFGHTFLHLVRPSKLGRASSDLNDDVVNFAAAVRDEDAMSYALKGMLGGFHGKFSLEPYYFKVQEYNNYESRDLWEYSLNLSAQELHRLTLSLWELGPQAIDYYYFDHNCSFILLMLLDAARLEGAASDEFLSWVTPSDALAVTLKHYSSSNQALHPLFRPSIMTRLKSREALLSLPEHQLLMEILAADKQSQLPEAFLSLNAAAKARILDTGLDYVDFREKLAGSAAPEKLGSLRSKLLNARAETPLVTQQINETPQDQNPALGHSSTRFGLALGERNGDLSLALDWQPVLHDLAASSLGFREGMDLEFMRMVFDYVPARKHLYLDDLQILSVIKIAPWDQLTKAKSWQLKVGVTSFGECSKNSSSCYKSSARVGYGFAAKPFTGLTVFTLGLAELGSSTRKSQEFYGAPGAELGLIWSPTPTLHGTLGGAALRRYAVALQLTEVEGHATAVYALTREWELRCSSAVQRLNQEKTQTLLLTGFGPLFLNL